jgi:tRNA threonylcarbamoyladenosine biosynthesis protein TsaE
MNSIFVSASVLETQNLSKQLLENLNGSNVIALTGELGSGKTTFSQGLGHVLGVKRIVSPTYILLRQYQLPKSSLFSALYHADLYRLSDPEEALSLGLTEIWSDPDNLLLIEWPEKILDLLPENSVHINFRNLDNDKREITITS